FEQHDYNSFLLDGRFPKLAGEKVLTTIRHKQKNVPVIFITARDSIHDRVEGLDLGANDYLVKPFSLEELSARIRAQLRKQTLNQPSI
ncbi:response regulator, partial [Acinetobacter baumannii]